MALDAATPPSSSISLDSNLGEGSVFARSHARKSAHKNHNKLRKDSKGGAKLTFYSGNQLLAPACGGKAPTDDDLVAAVTPHGGIGKCGDRIKLTYKGSSVTVTVRDYCAACTPRWMDLTKGAFKRLAPLSQGVIEGATFAKA
ncbi:hypothetical protein IE53DRAFT_366507 [Violaceomyces palustris]|uniref:Uncharacterized protein n=1 Tax=Violaceomyces palustris TaxID=1673888 RepID=A0ACD0P566_9BASI|nr:hypothetical protein IE53DRAFT_366507 [Violaceomyces palustris]